MVDRKLTFEVDEELFNAAKHGNLEKLQSAFDDRVSSDARISTFGNKENFPLLSIASKVLVLCLFFFLFKIFISNFIYVLCIKRNASLIDIFAPEWPIRDSQVFA